MSIVITEDLQKIIDAADSSDDVISLTITDVPEHLLSQIEIKECVYLDYIIKSGDQEIELVFVVPTALIDENTYKIIPIKELLSCGCTQIDEGGICGHSPFYNRGKTTYFVRTPDQYLVPLQDKQPKVISIFEPMLGSLVEKLRSLDKVNYIQIEEVLDESLKNDPVNINPLMVIANIDVVSDLTNTGIVSFIITESVYNNELGHEWAVDNLKDLIQKNNE